MFFREVERERERVLEMFQDLMDTSWLISLISYYYKSIID